MVIATLLLGCAEVLRDNAAQTLLPSIVDNENLERANGRLWAAEATANQFAGPPLGSLLLGLSFALPFVIDAVTFLVAGALIATIGGTFRPVAEAETERRPWREDLREGITWLRGNRVLWPMALVLGAMNGTDALAGATLVIFAQEVLGAGPFLFAVIGTGGAIGAIVGGWFVPNLSKRFGGGTVLAVAVAGPHGHPLRDRVRQCLAGGARRIRADGDVRHRVERGHGQPPTVGDPGSATRTRQQRLPLSRLGFDPDRGGDRRGRRGTARWAARSRDCSPGSLDHLRCRAYRTPRGGASAPLHGCPRPRSDPPNRSTDTDTVRPVGHRRDIEGLRALAVIAVIAYHAGVPFTGGGFVGVDVFLVISGFLITSLLIREWSETGGSRWLASTHGGLAVSFPSRRPCSRRPPSAR